MIEKFIQKELEYFQPMIERQILATEENRQAWKLETVAQRLERISLETYDLCEGKVIQGIFKGLKLNRDTWWGKSDLGSQCLGLYEKEILDFISSQVSYEVFLDIGAADGYYALGMLHSKLAKHSICFEMSNKGQQSIKDNWVLNNKPGKLDIFGEANENSICEIAATLPENTLILIDIEGFEFSLLTPKVISILNKFTIIIEIHNWVTDFTSKYVKLLNMLNIYYDIKIINPIERNTHDIPLLRSFTDDNRLLVTSERRPCLMRFLKLNPKRRIY